VDRQVLGVQRAGDLDVLSDELHGFLGIVQFVVRLIRCVIQDVNVSLFDHGTGKGLRGFLVFFIRSLEGSGGCCAGFSACCPKAEAQGKPDRHKEELLHMSPPA
jgi:hypothetical protein